MCLRKGKSQSEIRKKFVQETGIDDIGLSLLEYSDLDEQMLDIVELDEPRKKKNKNNKTSKPKRHAENTNVLSIISKRNMDSKDKQANSVQPVNVMLQKIIKYKVFFLFFCYLFSNNFASFICRFY